MKLFPSLVLLGARASYAAATDLAAAEASARSLQSPTLSYEGNNGDPATAFPLGICQGDCDSDSECQTGLICYNPGSNWHPDGDSTKVPGCDGVVSGSTDYCFAKPENWLWYRGNNWEVYSGRMNFPLGNCESDCDDDTDCQGTLQCHTGSGDVPGCIGDKGSSWKHYCFNRPETYLHNAGNDGVPAEAFPLGKCEGDCDADTDCAGNLACFQINAPIDVPGCTGGERGSWQDYCFELPPKFLHKAGNNGSPAEAFPLGECLGDCDNDTECAPGLKCFHRTSGEAVPGCAGYYQDDGTDYCFDPTVTDEPTFSPSSSPTPKPTESPTSAPSTSPTSSPTLYPRVANVLDAGTLVSDFGCYNSNPDHRPRAFDGNTESYFCDRFEQADEPGLILIPEHNKMSVVEGLRVYSANSCEGCDPVSFKLEGRTDSAAAWTLAGEGDLPWTSTGRNSKGLSISSTYEAGDAALVFTEVSLSNTAEYSQYKLTFTATRDLNTAALQFAEVELVGILYEDASSLPSVSVTDDFVQVLTCPPSGTSKAVVPGAKIATLSPASVFCGIFIEKEDGALVPYTRSYDSLDWEASPGPHAMATSDIDCVGVDGCKFTLPDPSTGNGYTILSKDSSEASPSGRRLTTSATRKEIATFLEMLTFGPTKAEIESLDDGSWGEAARAQYVRDQIDRPMTSHREYYRRRTNTKWDAITYQARSNHPCSPNSKWVRYSYLEQDRFRTVSDVEKVTTFETVPSEAGMTYTIHEADQESDVSGHGPGSFYSGTGSGFSGIGYYDFNSVGDFLEFTINAAVAGTEKISFRYMNGSGSYNGNRPLQLWVNDVMVEAVYDFIYTDSWSYYRYSELMDVDLVAGANKIKLVLTDQSGGPNIDHLRIGKPPAMLLRTDGWPRAIARDGVRLLDDYSFEFTDGLQVIFDDYPKPPQGDLYYYDIGRLNVILPDGSENNYLDIGNPPVDFTGYEQYLDELPHGYFIFDGTETWNETGSDLFDGVLRRDQELLLASGLNDPLCDTLPPFSNEGNAPIYGKLPDGTWLSWAPTIQLEDNGPTINAADMTGNVLSDGGGAFVQQTEGKMRCSNVMRSFLNEDTCFLSTENHTCASSEVEYADTAAGVIVCGSRGEVSNDPALPETFAVDSNEHDVTDNDIVENQKSVVWTEIALTGADQARQRMAWALAQIITTVPENIDGDSRTELYVNFYDSLVRHAFGSFRDILREAAYSPLMGEHLTYYRSKSHAYVYNEEDKKNTMADENFSREIMQLFSIGLISLNDDGTPKYDDAGNLIETYTNDHIESFARAWTGFDRVDPRGGIEQGWSENRLDPMKINAAWRDAFPKPNLSGGYIGDGYPLCQDLADMSFLKAGAKYRLLGGSPRPELMQDPSQHSDPEINILHFELDQLSPLYQELSTNQVTVELNNDLQCFGHECEVDAVRVVKVGSLFWEFVEKPCVQLAFYDNGKVIQLRDNDKLGTMCANPELAHAREACCREDRYKEVRTAHQVTGQTSRFEGERMSYATAQQRCTAYGRNLCQYERVQLFPVDDWWRKGYYWTNKDCSIRVKVNSEGQIAIVHDAKPTHSANIHYHVNEADTLNWIRVNWNGGLYPGSSETSTCTSFGCKSLEDESCLCGTSVADEVVFTDISEVSKEAVMSQLFQGAALGPHADSTPTTNIGEGLIVHMVEGQLDGSTVFEVEDKGRTFFLKNTLSTVVLEGWTMPPKIYEAEEATIAFASPEPSDSATGGSYVEIGTNSSSYVQWDVEVPSAGKYLISFRYAFDASPKRMDVEVNGVLVPHPSVNPELPIVWYGGTPSAENLPLKRCEGDCDNDDHCADGLFCMQNLELEEVPGCSRPENTFSGGDFCVDFADFTSVGFLPTGGTSDDWHLTEPIEVDLNAGANTIKAQIPVGEFKSPNLDHLLIEGLSAASTATFRNPPHFMSFVPDYNNGKLGEQTVRDAEYETEAALDEYFYHDNVAPFLCTRIAQRFSFSNPAPRFVSACTQAFKTGTYTSGGITFGDGKYGSLEALAAVIFLDAESTDPAVTVDPSHGSIREPMLKVLNVMRSLLYKTHIPSDLIDGPPLQTTYNVRIWEIVKRIGHGPYDFPSVFSYYLPEYTPDDGPTLAATLTSPETMVLTAPNAVGLLNGLFSLVRYGLTDCNGGFAEYPGYGGSCNDDGQYTRSLGHLHYVPSGATLEEKADDLALLLTAGRLSKANRDTIVAACSAEPDEASKVRCMTQLIFVTGEFQTTNVVTQNGEARSSSATAGGTPTQPYKAIVYFYLSGGLDSFNLLAPYTCAPIDVHEAYRTVRGKSGLSEGIGMPLTRLLEIPSNNPAQPCTSFGIHESFPVLKELYNQTKAAFISNAGLLAQPLDRDTYRSEPWQSNLYSHNGMQRETWKDDLMDLYDGTGVAGRIADVLTQSGIRADTFSIDGRSVVLIGETGQGSSQTILGSTGLAPFNKEPSIANMQEVMKALNNKTTSESGFFAETWSSKFVEMLDKQDFLEAELEKTTVVTAFPESSTADEFKLITQIMQTAEARGSERDIFYTSMGGFDTHSNVDLKLIENLSAMNDAIKAFVAELKVLDLWKSTVVVQFSEFGRTLSPNSGAGSDHAWGGNHFMFGGSVNGGKVLGKYPDNFEEGDPANIMLSRGRIIPTTPWDSMLHSVAEWFGVPANSVEMEKVLPMHTNFPPDKIYGKDDLFVSLGVNEGESTS